MERAHPAMLCAHRKARGRITAAAIDDEEGDAAATQQREPSAALAAAAAAEEEERAVAAASAVAAAPPSTALLRPALRILVAVVAVAVWRQRQASGFSASQPPHQLSDPNGESYH